MNDTLLQNPTTIVIFIACLLAAIYWIKDQPFAKPVFKVIPFVLWIYFLPMIATTIGILPSSSPAYDWITNYFLPASLVLLLISADIPTILKVGPKALITFFAGTLGIMIGAPISLFLFQSYLPEDAWMGFAALSGSWIGGGANMMAVKESVGTPDSMMGIVIIVDTMIGYGWMAVVVAFSAFQKRVDKKNKVDTSIIESINTRMEKFYAQKQPLTLKTFSLMIALGLSIGALSLEIGRMLPPIGDVLSSFGWTVILVLTISIALSFTKLQQLEKSGSSTVGNYMLYFLLASIGAKANLTDIFTAPVFLLAGAVWILIHASVLYTVGRLIKAPMFLIATSSQANIGGVVSAPIVASIYQPSLAPVGLLLGLLGNITGSVAALMTAQLCAWVVS